MGRQTVESSTEHQRHAPMYQFYTEDVEYGATATEAAMRRFVRTVLGTDVELL